jgi:hypothetical protein
MLAMQSTVGEMEVWEQRQEGVVVVALYLVPLAAVGAVVDTAVLGGHTELVTLVAAIPAMGELVALAPVEIMGVVMEPVVVDEVQEELPGGRAGLEGHREVVEQAVAVLIRPIPLVVQEARAAMGP